MSESPRDPGRWADSQGEWHDVARGLAARASVERGAAQRERLWAAIEAQVVSSAPGERPAGGRLPDHRVALKLGTMVLTLAGLGALYVHLASSARDDVAPKPAPLSAPAPPASEAAPLSGPAPSSEVVPAPPELVPAPSELVLPAKQQKRVTSRHADETMEPGAAERGSAAAELSLLTRARRVLLADPQRSLALADSHARAYPRGLFAEEREVLAVEALQRAGRNRDARARARRFAGDYPNSTHVLRMKALSGD